MTPSTDWRGPLAVERVAVDEARKLVERWRREAHLLGVSADASDRVAAGRLLARAEELANVLPDPDEEDP